MGVAEGEIGAAWVCDLRSWRMCWRYGTQQTRMGALLPGKPTTQLLTSDRDLGWVFENRKRKKERKKDLWVTPPVCVPAVLGALVVWRHNPPHKKGLKPPKNGNIALQMPRTSQLSTL